jgi:hypothetical protein
LHFEDIISSSGIPYTWCVSRYVPEYTGMYRLVRCYSTSWYILSLKITYLYILVCTFWEKYIPLHTSIYLNRYISVYTSTYRYKQVHGGSALVLWYIQWYIQVRSCTCEYIHCSPVLFPLLQHPAGPVLARMKVESCRIAAAERHTSSMTIHFIALFKLARAAA